MKIVNLTPHVVNIYDESGQNVIISFPSEGEARVDTPDADTIGFVNGLPVKKNRYDAVKGLPEPEQGTIFIVSMLVCQALRERGIYRGDVLSPNTSPNEAIRNEKGQIIGVKSLACHF